MKALKQFTKKRLSRLQALLTHFPGAKEKEELHQIRLEIKKIKALLRLIHFNKKDFRDHKHYMPLRTIFREAGKIRDTGIRKELLEHYTSIHTPFFKSPDKSIKRFIKQVPDYVNVVRKQKKILLKEIDKIKAHTFTLYLHKKNNELNSLVSNRFTQKDLHVIRKLIKEIIYLTAVETKKGNIDPFLVESDNLIGNWHDKQTLIPWMRANTPKEKETIVRLKSESNTDLQTLRKMIKDR
jgi:hypothetical protein